MASETSKSKAPDGKPWPRCRVAVDNREQRPWAFGYVPAPWLREGERGPVHHGEVDRDSLVNELLCGPWESERATLDEADYVLLGPSGAPISDLCGIERKSYADLRDSLSAGHARLMAEMERLSSYTTPVLIVEAPIEVLLGSRSGLVEQLDAARVFLLAAAKGWASSSVRGKVSGALSLLAGAERIAQVLGHTREEAQRPGRVSTQALLGSLLSILVDHRIPPLMLPSRAWAEYAAAWILRRSWRRWLLDNPDGLAAERARLAKVDAETVPDDGAEGRAA